MRKPTSTAFITFLFPRLSSSYAAPPTSSPPIKRVTIVGGTHGNEYTGVWCIKSIDEKGDARLREQWPSLRISTLLANPAAFRANKRFIDLDLNREFTFDKLNHKFDENDETTVEQRRAKEINTLLGPKFGPGAPCTDLIIDLHTTTSNMGTTLIVPEGDKLMTLAAAYVMSRCRGDDVRCLMHSLADRKRRPNLSSVSKHGFTIEVGPVPQGVLRHDIVEKTERAVDVLLDFVQRWNEDGGVTAMEELRRMYKEGVVPCFRSAPAKRCTDMSGKITWEGDEVNPNFPAVMVHKSVQDGDFKKIRTGDPLFVTAGGKVIRYDGSHGDEVYLIFVNEGGYYYQSSGTGIGVALACYFDLSTGMLTEHPVETCIDEKGRTLAAAVSEYDYE